jgi:hypothetical protein
MKKTMLVPFISFKNAFYLFVFVGLLLTGCGQAKKESDDNDEINNLKEYTNTDFILESLFFCSIDDLIEKYGESNIQTEFFEACETCGPEGSPLEESFYRTTLFPNSEKEVKIDWNSNQTIVTRVNVESIVSVWRTKEGFKIGDEITKIKSYFKNKPFEMFYFYEFIYNVNENYSLSFNADLNFTPYEAETFLSTDARLNKLVLCSINLNLPGYR